MSLSEKILLAGIITGVSILIVHNATIFAQAQTVTITAQVGYNNGNVENQPQRVLI